MSGERSRLLNNQQISGADYLESGRNASGDYQSIPPSAADGTRVSNVFIGKFKSILVLSYGVYTKYILQETLDDDAVSLGVKQFIFLLILSILLWLTSYLLVISHVIKHNHCNTDKDWRLFVPMWIGSCVGVLGSIGVSVQVCRTVIFVTRERRLYMIAQGIARDTSYVDYESLPLMRRLFCWSIVSGISFILALVTQILYYDWFAGSVKSLSEALLPLVSVIIIYMVYMFAVNIFSIQTCVIYMLLTLQLVSASH